jgi:hypothetical protein
MAFLLGLAVGLFVATVAFLAAAVTWRANPVTWWLLGGSGVIIFALIFATLDRVVERMRLDYPRAVSKWFRLDWQYILRAGRLPAIKPVVVVLVAFPVLGGLTSTINLTTPGFKFIWLGGVTSLMAFALTWLRCPSSIREYETFKAFDDVGHSHRWIGWLFRTHEGDYIDLATILREVIDKKLTVRELDICVPSPLADACAKMQGSGSASGPAVLEPVNVDRDLYVGFRLEGQLHIIPLQEDDPKISEKIKELFWIISTNLLGSRPLSRYFIWSLYAITLVLFAVALVINVATPMGGLQELFG